jgi:hypothetical protein
MSCRLENSDFLFVGVRDPRRVLATVDEATATLKTPVSLYRWRGCNVWTDLNLLREVTRGNGRPFSQICIEDYSTYELHWCFRQTTRCSSKQSLFILLPSHSTCFGCLPHPSSDCLELHLVGGLKHKFKMHGNVNIKYVELHWLRGVFFVL